MNFLGILVAVSIVTAIFGSYCATRNANDTKGFEMDARDRSKAPRLHFVERRQFADLYESNQVLFRLQDSQAIKEKGETSPQRLGITLQELDKCIPWIPADSKIFICGPDGFGPSLLKQLGALNTERDLFLIEDLPHDLSPTSMVVS